MACQFNHNGDIYGCTASDDLFHWTRKRPNARVERNSTTDVRWVYCEF